MFESIPLAGQKRRMFDGKDLLKKYWNKLRRAKHIDYTEKTNIYEEAPDEPSPPFTPEAVPGKKKKRLDQRLEKKFADEKEVADVREQWLEEQEAKLEEQKAKKVCCQKEAISSGADLIRQVIGQGNGCA